MYMYFPIQLSLFTLSATHSIIQNYRYLVCMYFPVGSVNTYTSTKLLVCMYYHYVITIRLYILFDPISPGWDKHSYGYHGDNGHTFNSAGNGQPYGPTFTTGDVVGCGVNLIDNTCFYTKNGVNLGVAFTDLPVSEMSPSPIP